MKKKNIIAILAAATICPMAGADELNQTISIEKEEEVVAAAVEALAPVREQLVDLAAAQDAWKVEGAAGERDLAEDVGLDEATLLEEGEEAPQRADLPLDRLLGPLVLELAHVVPGIVEAEVLQRYAILLDV